MSSVAIDCDSGPTARPACSGALDLRWRRDILAALLLCVILAGCSTQPVNYLPAGGPRAQVVNTAYRMLGAPYHLGGESPRGFDCSGLVWFSYEQAGLNLPRTVFEQYLRSVPVPTDRLQPGDLLFFTLKSRGVSHVGIYVGDGKFIHAPSNGKRVTQARLDDPFWRNRLVRAGRVF